MIPKLHQLTLEITRKCPNKCLHCSSLSSPLENDNIEFHTAKSLIDEAKSLGAAKIILSGGEPFEYPFLMPLVKYIAELNIDVVVYTSGLRLNCGKSLVRISDDEIDHLIKLGVKRFNVSLHSSDSKAHDRFTMTPHSFELTGDFIDMLVDRGCDIHVHTVVNKNNIPNISSLAQGIISKGVNTLRLLRLAPQGRALDYYEDLEPVENDQILLINQIKKINDNCPPHFRLILGPHIAPLLKIKNFRCGLDKEKLLIEPDGCVAVCPALKGAKGIADFPNAFNTPIRDIIKSRWRDQISNFKTSHPQFECPAQSYYKTLKKTGVAYDN